MIDELSDDQLNELNKSLLAKSNKVINLIMRNYKKFEGTF